MPSGGIGQGPQQAVGCFVVHLEIDQRNTITAAKRGDRWLLTGYHASVNAFDNPVLALATRKVALWAALGGAVAGAVLTWGVIRLMRSRSPAS